MERYVRKATAKDLPVVLDLIESGRRIMRENGNPHQWGDSHPTVAQIEGDIALDFITSLVSSLPMTKIANA